MNELTAAYEQAIEHAQAAATAYAESLTSGTPMEDVHRLQVAAMQSEVEMHRALARIVAARPDLELGR